jgi:hypothetical protein
MELFEFGSPLCDAPLACARLSAPRGRPLARPTRRADGRQPAEWRGRLSGRQSEFHRQEHSYRRHPRRQAVPIHHGREGGAVCPLPPRSISRRVRRRTSRWRSIRRAGSGPTTGLRSIRRPWAVISRTTLRRREHPSLVPRLPRRRPQQTRRPRARGTGLVLLANAEMGRIAPGRCVPFRPCVVEHRDARKVNTCTLGCSPAD